MIAELIAKIVADVTDLNKAEVAVRQFESTTKDAFKRTGDLRAGRAIESFIENLTTGNVGGAIESITSRITAFGLAGSAAMALVGAGVAYLIKNVHEFDAVLKEGQTNVKATPIAGAPLQDIENHITATVELMEKMGSKTRTFWANFAMAIPGTATQAAIKAQQDELKVLEKDLSNQVAKQREAVEVTALSSAVGERDAMVVKSRVQWEEQYAKAQEQRIKLMDAIGKMHMPAEMQLEMREQVKSGTDQSKQVAADALAAMDRQAALKDKIADIGRQAIGPELQAAEVTKARITYLEQVRASLSASNEEGRKAVDHSIEQLKLDQQHADAVNAAKGLKPIFDATQLSFKDLLQADPHAGSVRMIEGHQAALRAQREQTIGENLAARGFQQDAFIHLARAAEIKAGIPILKESEKNEYAFRAAIDSAVVFQNMSEYLQSIAQSVSKTNNPFLNKN
jgi:hypothetical protein